MEKLFMGSKVINMCGTPGQGRLTERYYKNERIYGIDYRTGTGSLILDMCFSEGCFHIIKCIKGAGKYPPGILFQRFEELKAFLAQFGEAELYENNGRLFFSEKDNGTGFLYEIRRVTVKGEAYLDSKGYGSHQGIMDALWQGPGYTEPPSLYGMVQKIQDSIFMESGEDMVYHNEPSPHTVIESHATKRDDGYYSVGGREREYQGPAFEGEDGAAVEAFLEAMFMKGTVIVKGCRGRFLLMREYGQLSRLWKKAGSIEIRDIDGDMSIQCGEEDPYVVRTVTEAGMRYLEMHPPGPDLLKKVWEGRLLTAKAYK